MTEDNIVKVPRTSETYTQDIAADIFSIRYVYARSAESRQEDEIGQDYLTFSLQDKTISFAICDGVSQSFFGDLAAQILGDALLVWLEDQNAQINKNQLVTSLTSYLEELTETGSSIVENHTYAENIPIMLKSVLEEKRQLGSESMYICGRIDLDSKNFPKGRVLLSWMGDIRLRAWKRKKEITQSLGVEQETGRRWSTKNGLIGDQLGFYQGPLQARRKTNLYNRFLVYTDGFSLLDLEDKPLPNQQLDDLINQAMRQPENDDLAMIEVTF